MLHDGAGRPRRQLTTGLGLGDDEFVVCLGGHTDAALLVISGYARIVPLRFAFVAASLPAIFAITELSGLLWLMPQRYAMLPLWSGGMARLESLQPALLGRYTLLVALCCEVTIVALDRGRVLEFAAPQNSANHLRLSMCQNET